MIHIGILTSHMGSCSDIWGCVGHWCWKKLYSLISQKWTQAHKQYWTPDTGAAGYCSSPHPFSSSYKSTVGTRRGHGIGNHSRFSLTETHWWKNCTVYYTHLNISCSSRLSSSSYNVNPIVASVFFSLLSRKTLQTSSFFSEPTQSIQTINNQQFS